MVGPAPCTVSDSAIFLCFHQASMSRLEVQTELLSKQHHFYKSNLMYTRF